jgi:hypothetical protein
MTLFQSLCVLLLLLFISCAHASPKINDADLFPYVESFTKGKTTLHYLASAHAVKTDSPTFQLIDRELKEFKPQAIVLESFPRAFGISPERMVAHAKTEGANGIFRGGEDIYAVKRAAELHIEFVGGEPDQATVLKAVLAQGFTIQDLLGFYFVRQIPADRRVHPLDEKSMPGTYQHYLETWSQELKVPQAAQPSYTEFKNWFQATCKIPFKVGQIDAVTTAPREDGKCLHALSALINRVRIEVSIATLREMLDRHDRVLMIYGGSHLQNDRKEIEKILGPAASRFPPQGHEQIVSLFKPRR